MKPFRFVWHSKGSGCTLHICSKWALAHILFCMKNVLLIDSGSGGVNILKECVRVCPFCNFLLFCDDKNLPYGSKSQEVLQEITIKNLRDIKKFFNFEIVVLACNTLSCTCLQKVREEFSDTIFVGTVPAVKPALEKFDAKDVLVLATEATIKHNVLIGKNPNLQTLALPSLASQIDAHLDELEVLKADLVRDLSPFLEEKTKPKAVVLGCTHYLAVKDLLQEILGEDVMFFDSANGVARRLEYFVLEEKGEKKALSPSFQVQIMVSGNVSALQSFWWWFEKGQN